jgi:hypothetical protein
VRLTPFILLFLAVSCVAAPSPIATPAQLADVLAPLQQPRPGDVLVVAAGDIARCGPQLVNARATAAIVQQFPSATVLTIGDNAYQRGRPDEFANCYDPTWGAFKSRTHPSPGNHEYYSSSDAAGYFGYFNVPQYYSFEVGNWHLVSLDSMIDMTAASPQVAWLEKDLDANRKTCILAYWHHPRFSSGIHGFQDNDRGRQTAVLWRVLAGHHATLILNGHDHDYERFAPRDGIREIVAGTGGGELRPFIRRLGGSEARDDRHYGVLLLTLHPRSYEWHFIGTDGVIHDQSEGVVECTPVY